jgi:hypothetical protein
MRDLDCVGKTAFDFNLAQVRSGLASIQIHAKEIAETVSRSHDRITASKARTIALLAANAESSLKTVQALEAMRYSTTAGEPQT